MTYKIKIVILSLLMVIISSSAISIQSFASPPKNVLILYEKKSFFADERDMVFAMEMLLSFYQAKVEAKSILDDNIDFENYDVVLVLTLDKAIDDNRLLNELSQYKGEIIWLGAGIDEFLALSDYGIEYTGETYDLLSVSYKNYEHANEQSFNLATKRLFYKVKIKNDYPQIVTNYSSLTNGVESFPFIVGSRNLYYVSRVDLNEPLFYIFSDFLGNIFHKKHPEKNEFLISIEDIHVFSDYNNLRELADIMHQNNIPFTIGFIPLIQQEGSNYITSFTEVTDFIDTLKYMQSKGGSIILHTYPLEISKNELRKSRIYNGDIKSYFDDIVIKCINEGLYPIGFETPYVHLPMDEYLDAKDIFTSAFGQISSTEGNYVLYPYKIENSSIFNRYYPFNLGYVQKDSNDEFGLIKSRLDRIKIVKGSFLGVTFHSSLDKKYLEELVLILKKSNLTPFNPLSDNHNIKTSLAEISIEQGHISYEISEIEKNESLINKISSALSSAIGVILFITFSLFIVLLIKSIHRQKKNLFR